MIFVLANGSQFDQQIDEKWQDKKHILQVCNCWREKRVHLCQKQIFLAASFVRASHGYKGDNDPIVSLLSPHEPPVYRPIAATLRDS